MKWGPGVWIWGADATASGSSEPTWPDCLLWQGWLHSCLAPPTFFDPPKVGGGQQTSSTRWGASRFGQAASMARRADRLQSRHRSSLRLSSILTSESSKTQAKQRFSLLSAPQRAGPAEMANSARWLRPAPCRVALPPPTFQTPRK